MYRFLELLEPAGSGGVLVLCSDESGRNRYATLEEWREGEITIGTPLDHEGAEAGAVDARSSTADKLALFRDLFSGREYVHAESYHDRRRDHIAYSPACANFWKRGVCGRMAKPPVRCSDCEGRAFTPLTNKLLICHMRGDPSEDRGVIGVYPIFDDNLVRFLVIDFDDEGWRGAVTAFRRVCASESVPVAVERSRSGDGAHAWLFFSEPVDAVRARRLGSTLLTRAMGSARGISFDSYDRMIPCQDSVPRDGFGNLVALPFQGNAMREAADDGTAAARPCLNLPLAYPKQVSDVLSQLIRTLGQHVHGHDETLGNLPTKPLCLEPKSLPHQVTFFVAGLAQKLEARVDWQERVYLEVDTPIPYPEVPLLCHALPSENPDGLDTICPLDGPDVVDVLD